MTRLSLWGGSRPALAARPFLLVDVETTGLRWESDRVIQVAVMQVDERGRIEDRWSSLVDPLRDPGPTHIHGISADMLRGAPTFTAVAPHIAQLAGDRVIVAHNAIFDWRFLRNEALRAAVPLACSHRLCTVALARRLDLDLPNLKLPTLAGWAGVRLSKWHNAAADVEALHGVFVRLLTAAHRSGLTLPFAVNSAESVARPTVRAPRIESRWRAPGTWRPGTPLVQGTKLAITGGTRIAREQLYDRSVSAGLIPMNSVSGRTGLLVCNDTSLDTVKHRQAIAMGLPVVSEQRFVELLGAVAPGTPIGTPPPRTAPTRLPGPLGGQRVLVLGGPHDRAVEIRERIVSLAGRAAVNLTPAVTHIVELDDATAESRYPRTTDLSPARSLHIDPSRWRAGRWRR